MWQTGSTGRLPIPWTLTPPLSSSKSLRNFHRKLRHLKTSRLKETEDHRYDMDIDIKQLSSMVTDSFLANTAQDQDLIPKKKWIIEELPWLTYSVNQFSRSIVSDCSWPHELQHARPPCPSPTPGVYSNSCPLSRWWPSSHLTFCRPLLLLPPIPPSIRVFSNESTLCIRGPKY